jgi:hypothetical protein
MITIKSRKDLIIAGNWISNSWYNLATRQFEAITRNLPTYNPEEDGWLSIFTCGTSNIQARELFGCDWKEVAWDGVTYDHSGECFVAMKCNNNQFVHVVIIPDDPEMEKLLPGLINSLEEARC